MSHYRPPTLEAVAARIGGDPSSVVVQAIYDATMSHVRESGRFVCDPWTPAHTEYVYRIAGNLWASKAHTLGVVDTGGDVGPVLTPRYDPVADRLMSPYRVGDFA